MGIHKNNGYIEGFDDPSLRNNEEFGQYSTQILHSFVAKCSGEENEQIETRAFKKIMNKLYSGSIVSEDDQIILDEEWPCPNYVKKEIGEILNEDMEVDEDDFLIKQKLERYTNQAKELLDKPLQRFGLELKMKYRIKKGTYENELHPIFYLTDIQKFINLLQEIQNDEDELLVKGINTVMYGLKDQLMQSDEQTIKKFQKRIPKLYEELKRNYLLYSISNFESIIFKAADEGYLRELINLHKLGFNIKKRDDEGINITEDEILPTFLQKIADMNFDPEESSGDKEIKFTDIQTEIYNAIIGLADVRHCKSLFLIARTYLLASMIYILECLDKEGALLPKRCKQDIIDNIQTIMEL